MTRPGSKTHSSVALLITTSKHRSNQCSLRLGDRCLENQPPKMSHWTSRVPDLWGWIFRGIWLVEYTLSDLWRWAGVRDLRLFVGSPRQVRHSEDVAIRRSFPAGADSPCNHPCVEQSLISPCLYGELQAHRRGHGLVAKTLYIRRRSLTFASVLMMSDRPSCCLVLALPRQRWKGLVGCYIL